MASSTIAPSRSSKPIMPTASTNGQRSPSIISSSPIPDTMLIGGRFQSSLDDCTRSFNLGRASSIYRLKDETIDRLFVRRGLHIKRRRIASQRPLLLLDLLGFQRIPNSLKKLRPALGGELAARDPVWDGEGWGCDRVGFGAEE